MLNYDVKRFITLCGILVLLDSIFLYSAQNMFSKQVEAVQKSKLILHPIPAILCYAVMAVGLYYFIIREHRSVYDAAMLGLLVFGTYELTNAAIFDDWNYQTVCIDIVWGMVLFGLSTYLVNKLNVRKIDFAVTNPASLNL